jgi:hypothetical protein
MLGRPGRGQTAIDVTAEVNYKYGLGCLGIATERMEGAPKLGPQNHLSI